MHRVISNKKTMNPIRPKIDTNGSFLRVLSVSVVNLLFTFEINVNLKNKTRNLIPAYPCGEE